ncbi:MAG: DEAD/DEAH box helicase [Anaerolineae bacterium]
MPETFAELGLSEPILKAVGDLGYEAPTPIQSETIGLLMAGRDVIGQAQTGTGKTAAFALPMLEKVDSKRRQTQAIVLTPTRELAVQVAEATHRYARYLGTTVLPVYGGQPIERQLRALRDGVQVVVGTPGRVMDHMRRGTLTLSHVSYVVLDEADEMLDMGFAEDIEWILQQAPTERQTALFSATMPEPIQRLAQKYLHDPVIITIEHEQLTVPTTEQTYYSVAPAAKLNALTTVLDHEAPTAAIIFTRTKIAASELTESLSARGYSVDALHGDMSQAARDSVMRRFRDGQVELLVATDVAARGLDIENVSHVFNYDIPSDPEAYVHRIGRTGRAGRSGTAITFVTPRERRLLKDIERLTGATMRPVRLPTRADIAARRVEQLKASVRDRAQQGDLDPYLALVESLTDDMDLAEIAAAALSLAASSDGRKPLLTEEEVREEEEAIAAEAPAERGMVRLFVDAGRKDGIRPADIVGAIANEAHIPGRVIGAIDIYDRFTFVEIPERYREDVLSAMRHTTLHGKAVTFKVAIPREGEAPRPEPQKRRTLREPQPIPRGGRRPPRPFVRRPAR